MNPLILNPQSTIPDLQKPFLVVVDTEDAEWNDDDFVCRLGRLLLDSGCRYFVCFGRKSEEIHDRLDDLIIEGDFPLTTMTTYRDDESKDEVANFAKSEIVMLEMKDLVVIARDSKCWETAFARDETESTTTN